MDRKGKKASEYALNDGNKYLESTCRRFFYGDFSTGEEREGEHDDGYANNLLSESDILMSTQHLDNLITNNEFDAASDKEIKELNTQIEKVQKIGDTQRDSFQTYLNNLEFETPVENLAPPSHALPTKSDYVVKRQLRDAYFKKLRIVREAQLYFENSENVSERHAGDDYEINNFSNSNADILNNSDVDKISTQTINQHVDDIFRERDEANYEHGSFSKSVMNAMPDDQNFLKVTKKDFQEKYKRKHQNNLQNNNQQSEFNVGASTSRCIITPPNIPQLSPPHPSGFGENNNDECQAVDENLMVLILASEALSDTIKKLKWQKDELVQNEIYLISGAGKATNKSHQTIANERRVIDENLIQMEEELKTIFKEIYFDNTKNISTENKKAHEKKSNTGDKNNRNTGLDNHQSFEKSEIGKKIQRATENMKFLKVSDVFKASTYKNGIVNRQKVQIRFQGVKTAGDLIESHAELAAFIRLCE